MLFRSIRLGHFKRRRWNWSQSQSFVVVGAIVKGVISDESCFSGGWRTHAPFSGAVWALSRPPLSALQDSPPGREEKGSAGLPPVYRTRIGSTSSPSLLYRRTQEARKHLLGRTRANTVLVNPRTRRLSSKSSTTLISVDVRTDVGDEAGGLTLE